MGACKLKLSFLDLSNNALSGLPPELGRFLCCAVLSLVVPFLLFAFLVNNVIIHKDTLHSYDLYVCMCMKTLARWCLVCVLDGF